MTGADRVREFRKRQADRIAELEAALADATARLAEADAALTVAAEEMERLRSSQCPHPASLVADGTCRACGSDVW